MTCVLYSHAVQYADHRGKNCPGTESSSYSSCCITQRVNIVRVRAAGGRRAVLERAVDVTHDRAVGVLDRLREGGVHGRSRAGTVGELQRDGAWVVVVWIAAADRVLLTQTSDVCSTIADAIVVSVGVAVVRVGVDAVEPYSRKESESGDGEESRADETRGRACAGSIGDCRTAGVAIAEGRRCAASTIGATA